jgi:hypothetical protein
MGRIEDEDGDLLTIAGVVSIAYGVFDTADGSEVDSGSLTPSAVLYDSLQLPVTWVEDSVGINFRWVMGPSLIPDGDKRYQVEVTFTPASGYAFVEKWQVVTNETYGS